MSGSRDNWERGAAASPSRRPQRSSYAAVLQARVDVLSGNQSQRKDPESREPTWSRGQNIRDTGAEEASQVPRDSLTSESSEGYGNRNREERSDRDVGRFGEGGRGGFRGGRGGEGNRGGFRGGRGGDTFGEGRREDRSDRDGEGNRSAFRGGRGGDGFGEGRRGDRSDRDSEGNRGGYQSRRGGSSRRDWGGRDGGNTAEERGAQGERVVKSRFDALAPNAQVRNDRQNRERRPPANRTGSWNFWTLLCGAKDSEVVFTDYIGFCGSEKIKEGVRQGWIKVPLFRPASDEEVCEGFQERLHLIAASVAECKELQNGSCRLLSHVRIGDCYLTHREFRFDSRPGPRLHEFNRLLEERTVREAQNQMEHYFISRDGAHTAITSNFVTEKFCGSHSIIETFLNARGFDPDPEEEFIWTATLNGGKQNFELVYDLETLQVQKIQAFLHKWNLNLLTAKGTSYRGTFREKADLRFQFDAALVGGKLIEFLEENGFHFDDLKQVVERVGENPVPRPGGNNQSALSDAPERSYRITVPGLASSSKLNYIREQYNRKFVKPHPHWPVTLMLRQFKFFKPAKDSPDLLVSDAGVEFRVTAELDFFLDPEVLAQTEFVSHLWQCCCTMQDLLATSLEV